MDFIDAVRDAGVIGAGGAGFPTYAKVNAKAEYILMNGAECEPLLRVDQQLLDVYSEEILEGFYETGKQVGAAKALIGIKKKHSELIEKLDAEIRKKGFDNYIQIVPMMDVYPAGDEQVLVYELTGRIVPEASIPLKVGCIVVNSETSLNIANALRGKPVTESYLTLAGDIPNRMTICVPVGMPLREVLSLSGVENLEDYAVIDGGPMMGNLLQSFDGSITKKNKGFILLKKDHSLIKRKSVSFNNARRVNKAACEQCRMCTDMCPRWLLGHNMQPHKVMRAYTYGMNDIEQQAVSQLCSGCNLCQMFSCPANLFPKLANDNNKAELSAQKIKYQPSQEMPQARSVRENRLVPSKRLIARLGLSDFDCSAALSQQEFSPDRLTVQTSQHIGAPALPIVAIGETVTKGQLIGVIPEGSLGATIHASLDGTVIDVQKNAIVIEVNKI